MVHVVFSLILALLPLMTFGIINKPISMFIVNNPNVPKSSVQFPLPTISEWNTLESRINSSTLILDQLERIVHMHMDNANLSTYVKTILKPDLEEFKAYYQLGQTLLHLYSPDVIEKFEANQTLEQSVEVRSITDNLVRAMHGLPRMKKHFVEIEQQISLQQDLASAEVTFVRVVIANSKLTGGSRFSAFFDFLNSFRRLFSKYSNVMKKYSSVTSEYENGQLPVEMTFFHDELQQRYQGLNHYICGTEKGCYIPKLSAFYGSNLYAQTLSLYRLSIDRLCELLDTQIQLFYPVANLIEIITPRSDENGN
ncbi:hypothetical protein RDWZM_002857 [Blomia tropicalis]|uniref:Uncharacterized protein n=1 Tax=Blomia tropicalis TaxID=40697 RepID=A0A9Q0MH33_BLOTA|nr:hypothetical protein BLOT_001227 [Blomia tropicalis]KAJ6224312.1 hypothetical protein RDWZM_002857 [Blomia tropicalis]